MLHEALTPYVKNKAVWFCPNDPYAGLNIDKFGIIHTYSSYAFNFCRYPWLSTQGLLWKHPITQSTPQWFIDFHTPSGYPLMQDSHNMNPSSPSGRILPLTPGCNHFGGINICYLDGHAKWVHIPIP
jgi:prepilin-type processing-associated H-X9-DG protein